MGRATVVPSGPDAALRGLRIALESRCTAGLTRTRRVVDSPQRARISVGGRELLSFASNDYLGLACAPAVVEAAAKGARSWGVGAGASHLVAGHAAPHEALENELAAFVAPCDGARALLFSSGYLANLSILTALAARGDAIFADRLNHASLTDGALLSRATLHRYRHAAVDELSALLSKVPARRRFIVTDAVFSMDGDIAPLRELHALAERTAAWLVVDDAHGFGVLGDGRGTLAHLALASARIVYMGTLGKAAGVSGAFVAAHPDVVETMVQFARPYIYTTAAPALLAEATRAALSIIRVDSARRAHLHALIASYTAGVANLRWPSMPSSTPIQPLLVGSADAAVRVSDALLARGILVPAIRPPTVPVGTARLRVSLSAAHSVADVAQLVAVLHDVANESA